MKKTYECMLLLDNREVREGWQTLKDHVHGLFAKHNCAVKSSRRWDERRLAYNIKQHQRATYLLIYAEAEAAEVDALRRDLRFDEKVIRDLVLRCDQIPEEAYQPEEAFDETAVPIEDVPTYDEEGSSDDDGDNDDDGDDRRARRSRSAKDDDDGDDDSDGDGDSNDSNDDEESES